MARFLLIYLLLGAWSLVGAAESPTCPVCGRRVTPAEKMKDDVSKPSRNLAVWNRSSCGNPLIGPGAMICPHDWYAYSALVKKWELSLEDPKGFALELDGRISGLPLPEKKKIRSRVVYSQSIDGDSVVHSVGFWCDTDKRYLDRLDEYAKRAGASVKIERDKIPGQTYASAETKRKLAVAANELVGTWTVVRTELSGEGVKSEIGDQWTFTADRIKLGVLRYHTEFSYRADASKKPAEIDFTKLTDPNIPPGKWIGIFTVDKDTLRICAVPFEPPIDLPRPTTFDAKHGDWQVLWVMKRSKMASR